MHIGKRRTAQKTARLFIIANECFDCFMHMKCTIKVKAFIFYLIFAKDTKGSLKNKMTIKRESIILYDFLTSLFFSRILLETFSLNLPASKDCSFETPPSFSVPLKMHNSPESYECYMSCAVTGNPKPHVTWYRNNISLNTNTNYYITNTCGVCSMVILKVGPKDSGEYTVIAENPLGRVECSTKLVVKGKNTIKLFCDILNSSLLIIWFNSSLLSVLHQTRMPELLKTSEI